MEVLATHSSNDFGLNQNRDGMLGPIFIYRSCNIFYHQVLAKGTVGKVFFNGRNTIFYTALRTVCVRSKVENKTLLLTFDS